MLQFTKNINLSTEQPYRGSEEGEVSDKKKAQENIKNKKNNENKIFKRKLINCKQIRSHKMP